MEIKHLTEMLVQVLQGAPSPSPLAPAMALGEGL